eukprot:SAG31_NODE_7056_length_1801_cov_2.856052_1_plen_273_part_00
MDLRETRGQEQEERDEAVFAEVMAQAATATENLAAADGGWELDLSWRGRKFGPAGAAAVASGITAGLCANLQWLGMFGDDIGDRGAAALAAALKCGKCGSLHTLALGKNQIGDIGANAIIEALRSVPVKRAPNKLHTLDLCMNWMSHAMENLVEDALTEMHLIAQGTVAAAQRLAFARIIFGVNLGRWSTSTSSVAAAMEEMPFVPSWSDGAPSRLLLVEACHMLPAVATAAVVARYAKQQQERTKKKKNKKKKNKKATRKKQQAKVAIGEP